MRHDSGVQIDLEALPDDPDVLQRMLREVVPELRAENEKLLLLIQRLLRHRCKREPTSTVDVRDCRL